jgi:DNA-binding MarR family transcriptional regulator
MPSPPDHLVNVVGVLCLSLTDAMRAATEDAAGLTGAGPAALVALQQFLGGRSTEDLAQATGLTHSGAVRLVDRLEAEGLVERRPGPDARSGAIVLTARGRATSRKVTAARAQAVAGALSELSGEQQRALQRIADALVGAITDQRLEARRRGDPPAGWMCRLCDFVACGRLEDECPAARYSST